MPEPAFDSSMATDSGASAALADIVRRAQARDHAAFEKLYQAFKTPIWRCLVSLVGEREVVNDLFQETFLRAWNGLPGTSGDLQFGPWLKRIAANAAIDYLRHNAIIEFFPLTDADQDEVELFLPQVAGPEASVSERECLKQALAALLPRYRICVLLQDQWGFSQREIAQLLSITEKCVSSYSSRGRAQLRQIYGRLSGDAVKRTRGETSQ